MAIAHDARADGHAGKASQGSHPRRGGRGRGQAVASLHHRSPIAGQVGQPARYRLRPRRPEPVGDAAGAGGRSPARSNTSASRSTSWSARGRGRHRSQRTPRRIDCGEKRSGRTARPRWRSAGRPRPNWSTRSAPCAASSSRSRPVAGKPAEGSSRRPRRKSAHAAGRTGSAQAGAARSFRARRR